MTVCGILAPALLPRGIVIMEQGGQFIDGVKRKFMIEVSPDRFIEAPQDEEIRTVFSEKAENISLELKCPFPDGKCIKVHYTIPVYYTIQLLCQMKVTGCKKAWYGSYLDESTVLLELTFGEEI